MKALTGQAKKDYLTTLKAYELERAKTKPIGKRVLYYKVQTEWINEMLREMEESK